MQTLVLLIHVISNIKYVLTHHNTTLIKYEFSTLPSYQFLSPGLGIMIFLIYFYFYLFLIIRIVNYIFIYVEVGSLATSFTQGV